MSLVDEVNNECLTFYKQWATFYGSTMTLVRSIRRVHHGVRLEQCKMSNCSRKLRLIVNERHDQAFKKLMTSVQDYSHNFLLMRQQYNSLGVDKGRFCVTHCSRAEQRYLQVCNQRDVIFHGVFAIIKSELQYAATHFPTDYFQASFDATFRLIETYNKYLVRLQHDPKMEKPSLHHAFTPEAVTPASSRLKRFTASMILQIIGDSRNHFVTKSIADTLLSRFEIPEENGTPLPWKHNALLHSTKLMPMDIFEEAIAKEEDENKRNQKKLDMALKMEFGDDFPGTDYLPTHDQGPLVPPVCSNAIDALVEENTKLLEALLVKFVQTTGVLVGSMLRCGKTGRLRIVKNAKSRLQSYFVERMWGTGADLVEEILMWQAPPQRPPQFPPPAILHPVQLFHVIKLFKQLCDKGAMPISCEASCRSLIEEARLIATMSFLDVSVVKGIGPYSRPNPGIAKLTDGSCCTKGGEHLTGAAEMLVWQINQIELTEVEKEKDDWPMAEEVCFFLCLGSLLSSFCCWARLRALHLLHTWNTGPFFLVSQADLPNILDQLKKLKIEERDHLVRTDDIGRLQMVGLRERAIMMIEKVYEEEVVENICSMCRTVCLAQLQNSMPHRKVWKGIGRIPHEPHQYVYDYIATILEKVLTAVSKLGVVLQKRAGSMVLKVVCYAWLEHIKVQKIRFSLWGAQQLLKDFHALAEWLCNFPGLDPEARDQILAVDVLRECEGVARLLMRQPPLVIGYASNNQVAPLVHIHAGRKRDKEVKLGTDTDDIPAEMYVPNQQLWLSLRARSSTGMCVPLLSCCSWPY